MYSFKRLLFLQRSIFLLVSVFILLATAHAEDGAKKCRYVRTSQLAVSDVDGRPLIKGSVNHVPANFLIDTGSYKTSLSNQFAARNQLKLSSTDRVAFGVGGESRVYSTRVEEFSIGSIKGGAITLHVDDEVAGKVFDGLIGADFLFQDDLELFLAEKLVRHFRPIDCDKTFLAYWDKNAIALDLQTGSARDARPTFMVNINGRTVKAMLDTGASVTFIHSDAAKRVGMDFITNGQTGGTASGIGKRSMKTEFAKFNSLAIGEELIQDAVIHVGDFWSNAKLDHYSQAQDDANRDAAEIIFGMDFLREHRVLFAISQRKLYLSYLGGPLFLSIEKK